MSTMVKSTMKTPEQCHAVFAFNFEHMQMYLFFIVVNYEHVFVSLAQDKVHKTVF